MVGFPLGYSQTEGKIAEAIQAIKDGAMEIDMVVNICNIKNGGWKKVEEEIAALKKAAGSHILKVIIETCYLAKEEKIAACKAVTNGSIYCRRLQQNRNQFGNFYVTAGWHRWMPIGYYHIIAGRHKEMP